MNEPQGARTGRSIATVGLLASAAAAVLGGVAWWAKPPAEAQAAPPVQAELEGTSFDVAPTRRAFPRPMEAPAPEVRKEETPAPAPVLGVAPKAPEKPVASPAGVNAAPAAPQPAPGPIEKKPDAEEEKPELITFSRLAFRYWPKTKDKGARDPFPEQIRGMNGKKVSIDGYMFPIDFEKGKVRSFLLSRAMFGCCYGDSPQMSELVKVQRADGKPMAFEAVARVTGLLEVGEEFDSDGYVDSIFRIKAESVVAAPGWR
jgi:hypothetical protein